MTNAPIQITAFEVETDALADRITEQITLHTFDPNDAVSLKRLVEGFADSRGTVRLHLAQTLAQIGDPATPFLMDALANHENPVVRRAAAKTITLIGDPIAIPTLVQALINDEDTVVKSSSVGAMARMGEAAVPILLDILRSTEYPESTKGLAAWALAFIGSEAKHMLYGEIKSEIAEVRYAVVGAIAKVAQENPDEQEAFDLLITALTDSAEMVREEAAAVLGNVSYVPGIPHLVKLLDHPALETRKAAVLSMMKIALAEPTSADDVKTVVEPLTAMADRETEPAVQAVIKLALTQIDRQKGSSDWD